ncbi:acyltransferase family protein [Aliivibrio fischeri]|uniref:acyltransferase family protein n=1 Tax=Aliivibrio fischeri TaxID=668 RepID=UPI0018C556AB|nr:acyltransferase [Aliivibrio fischeri]
MLTFKRATEKILSIQILRGIAAWLVVFHHYNQAFFSWDMSNSFLGEWFGVFSHHYGKLGVDIFFVISGFIIYLSVEKNNNVKKFVLNRISRVVPTYWFYTFILLLLTFIIPSYIRSEWNSISLLQSLFFINNENPSPSLGEYPLLTVGWTLNFEMLFYALCALSISVFKDKWHLPVIILLLFSSKIWPFDYFSYFFNSKYIREFGWGLLIGMAYTRSIIPDSNKVAILFLFISFFLFYLGGAQPYKIPAVVFLTVSFLTFKYSIFENKIGYFIKHLGDLSFSTYLIHAAISIPICLSLFDRTPTGIHELALFLLYPFITYILSYYSFKYIENNPLSRAIRNM